jgi:hypothetical protein
MAAARSKRRLRRLALPDLCGAICLGLIAAAFGSNAGAQIPAVKYDVRAARGLPVSPVYEGWYEVDGRRYVLFSYYNRNLDEIVDVSVGPRNQLAPGPPDQGQPTRFYPGLYYGVFAVALPADQPRTELTWTITANGQTLAIPTSLDPLYVISPQRENGTEWPGNTPPAVKLDQAAVPIQGPFGLAVSRKATVSRPLALDVWVDDDGLPPPRASRTPDRPLAGRRDPQGLALGWQVYRGRGAVTFSDVTPALDQGRARTTVTFSEPGDYTLHLTAIDSRSANRCCWTNGYVRVTVEAGAPAGTAPGRK